MEQEITLTLKLAIIKGTVANYTLEMIGRYNISYSGLARILREIADELDKS